MGQTIPVRRGIKLDKISDEELNKEDIYKFSLIELRDLFIEQEGILGQFFTKLDLVPFGTNFTYRTEGFVSSKGNIIIEKIKYHKRICITQLSLLRLFLIKNPTDKCYVFLRSSQVRQLNIKEDREVIDLNYV